jgi:hypothetical protein
MRRLLAVALVVGILAGCATAAPAVDELAWRQVPLPEGFIAAQLVELDGELLVGGSKDDHPALLVGDELAAIPVEPTTFYGGLARWYSFAVHGSQLRALGGRTGGGHGNPRWSTWVGDAEHLAEVGTPGIEVFGGWRGGGMVGIAYAGDEPVIVGGRAGDAAGLDIAIWREQGGTWVEQSSTGTPLGASDDVLPFPTSVAGGGSQLLITGFTQRLGGGEVHVVANAWVGTPDGGWARLDLPSDTTEGRADAASCAADGCVIVGHGDGRLLAWRYAGGEVTPLALPPVDADDELPAPVTWYGRPTLVAPGRLLVETDDGWRQRMGPPGIPIATAVVHETVYVLTAESGSVTLWANL